jgi:hypothetical protein
MSARTPAQHPKNNPAKRQGTGGVIQLQLDGIEFAPPKLHCTLTGDTLKLAKLLLHSPLGVKCGAGMKIGSTWLANHAKTLRGYGIDLITKMIPAPTAEKPRGRYGLYILTPIGRQQLELILGGALLVGV